MVTSGAGGYPYSEVVDLASTGTTCSAITNFEYASLGATGGFVNDKAVVCGGLTYSKCYVITKSSVNFLTNMLHKRNFVAGLVINDTFWLTGGDCSNSTEYISGIDFIRII